MVTTNDLDCIKNDLRDAYYLAYYDAGELAKRGLPNGEISMRYKTLFLLYFAIYNWSQSGNGSTTGYTNSLTQVQFDNIISRVRGLIYS